MSWICFQIELPHNKNQWGQKIKEECDRMVTQQVHEDNGLLRPAMEIVQSCIHKDIYYAAVRTISLSGKCCIKAAVFKIKIHENRVYNLLCDEKYEDELPQEQECPLAILRLLSDTKSEKALEWRKKCYAFHGILKEEQGRKKENIFPFQKKPQYGKRVHGLKKGDSKNNLYKQRSKYKIAKGCHIV